MIREMVVAMAVALGGCAVGVDAAVATGPVLDDAGVAICQGPQDDNGAGAGAGCSADGLHILTWSGVACDCAAHSLCSQDALTVSDADGGTRSIGTAACIQTTECVDMADVAAEVQSCTAGASCTFAAGGRTLTGVCSVMGG